MATFLLWILRSIHPRPRLDLRLLAHFVAIAEELHFTSKINETVYTPTLSDTAWCSRRSRMLGGVGVVGQEPRHCSNDQ
jgi:hypothetical protein